MAARPPTPAVLARDGAAEIEVKRSRFIGQVRIIESAEQASLMVAAIRKEHWQARHHCTAMVVAGVERSNDDGEPAGTAGAPMLQVLRGHGLTGALAVVTRYFGGTLLGTGGLIRAYTQATQCAIEEAGLVHLSPACDVTVTCPAADAGRCEHALRRFLAPHRVGTMTVTHGECAVFTVTLPVGLVAKYRAHIASHDASWPITTGPEHLAALP